METIDDGGPAFPGVQGTTGYGEVMPTKDPNGGTVWTIVHPGMSLRDYLAGQALVGLMSRDDGATYSPSKTETFEQWQARMVRLDVEHSYRVADAMIKAKRGEPK